MKKWITGALAILLGIVSIVVPFSGMHTAEAKTTEETARKLNIVTTIFPEYDWTRAILGDRMDGVELTMLLDNGTDLHSFQPAVKDIMKVSSCDLLIYVGGESDQWIEDALESAQNKDMKTINLMEVLGDTIKEEEKESPMSLYTNYLLWVLVGLAVTAVLIIFLWQYDKRYKKKIAAKQAATDVTKNDVSDRKEE